MNPFSTENKKEIERITKRVLEIFSKEYLRAFKYVFIRDAKKEQKKLSKGKEKEEEGEGEGEEHHPKPRPRGENRHKREVSPNLQVKIMSWMTLDTDIDPYVVYVVECSIGERSSSVYRRYNEFKILASKYGKQAPEAMKQFPTTKTFETRKFNDDFLYDRKDKLQKFLDSMVAQTDIASDPFFVKWLGLNEPEDPKFAEVFDIAFTNTKWRLWIWKRIHYDTEEQAISKLVVEEISREMFPNVLGGLPNQAQIRSAGMIAFYKTVSATVGPAVMAAWKVAKEAAAPLKPKISSVIDAGIEKLLECELEVKTQMKKGIEEGLSPIFEQMVPLFKNLSERGIEPSMVIVKELYPPFQSVTRLFDEIADSGDASKLDDVEKLIKDSRVEAEEKVNTTLQKFVESVVGDLEKQVTIEALVSIFSPLKRLLELINNSFDLFLNPVPHLRCIRSMCQYRQKLTALSPSADDFKEVLQDHLDQEESDVLWNRWWTYWDYRWRAWSIYYCAWTSCGYSVAQVVREYSFQYATLQKKFIKKWSFRFGDHLYHNSSKATPENWSDMVRESFIQGYKEAIHFFKKRAYIIFNHLVYHFFHAAIGVKVQETIMKVLAPVLEEVTKLIPSPLSEILDPNTIASEAIDEALMAQITSIVGECFIDPYVTAWKELTF